MRRALSWTWTLCVVLGVFWVTLLAPQRVEPLSFIDELRALEEALKLLRPIIGIVDVAERRAVEAFEIFHPFSVPVGSLRESGEQASEELWSATWHGESSGREAGSLSCPLPLQTPVRPPGEICGQLRERIQRPLDSSDILTREPLDDIHKAVGKLIASRAV
jgi:hypothetical protein